MFKSFFFVLLVALLVVPVHSMVVVHKPVEATVSGQQVLDVGKIAPGQAIELNIERKSGKAEKWDSLAVDSSLLPSGWKFEQVVSDETISGKVFVPKNAKTALYRLSLKAFNSGLPADGDSFFVSVSVINPSEVFDAGIDAEKTDSVLNSPVAFNVSLSNNSSAEAVFIVSSSFPAQWQQVSVPIVVAPHETKNVSLEIVPRVYGAKKAKVFVSSKQTSFSDSFDVELNVFPTLRGKFSAPLLGLPFYSISMLPFYFVNSLVSFK